MTGHVRDPNQRIFTAQDMANFWTWVVETGRGSWEAGLCLRGIHLIRTNGKGPSLCVLPEDQRYDEARQIVFVGARDS